VKISGVKEILEIGALGGYSGICLVRGLREEGHLTSLEL
jgi:predicted O-methyltransferase YrrM